MFCGHSLALAFPRDASPLQRWSVGSCNHLDWCWGNDKDKRSAAKPPKVWPRPGRIDTSSCPIINHTNLFPVDRYIRAWCDCASLMINRLLEGGGGVTSAQNNLHRAFRWGVKKMFICFARFFVFFYHVTQMRRGESLDAVILVTKLCVWAQMRSIKTMWVNIESMHFLCVFFFFFLNGTN